MPTSKKVKYETKIKESFGKCFGTQDFKERNNGFLREKKSSFTGK
jgi:enoyl-CoA hydratase